MEKNSLIPGFSLLVAGGSAGSLDVILELVSGLPGDLQAAVIIVVHRKNSAESVFPVLLASRTKLPVKEAEDKDAIEAGCIYVAPADYHLLIEKDLSLSLDFSEKINYSRPGIDATFETAAEAFGNRLACLLLSGASADGAEGLKAVKRNGGITMVQDPATAEVAYMPEQAIATGSVDYILQPLQVANVLDFLKDQQYW